MHWRRICVGARAGPPRSRLIELGWDWQEQEGLATLPPSVVVERALALFPARVCAVCFPTGVLERLPRETPRTRPAPAEARQVARFPPVTAALLNRYRGQLRAMQARLADGGHLGQVAQAGRLHDELGDLLDERRG